MPLCTTVAMLNHAQYVTSRSNMPVAISNTRSLNEYGPMAAIRRRSGTTYSTVLVVPKYMVVALFVLAFGSLQNTKVVFPGSTLAYSRLTPGSINEHSCLTICSPDFMSNDLQPRLAVQSQTLFNLWLSHTVSHSINE